MTTTIQTSLTKSVSDHTVTTTFSVLRAVQELEMNCDLKHVTQVQNMDLEHEGHLTIYGTETDGQLFYLVLSPELVQQIKNL